MSIKRNEEIISSRLKVLGTKGNGQVNPTLISRTGDTAYILTVINKDTSPRMFYNDGRSLFSVWLLNNAFPTSLVANVPI
jgi:hypothetical protein